MEEVFVDIGAVSDREVAERGLHIGSVGTFHTPFRRRDERTLLGKAFDDRTACNVLLHVIERLAAEEPRNSLLAVFSVQEEVGCRGVVTAAYSLRPDMALALENTIASDIPGVKDTQVVTRLGDGPAVTVADKSLIVPENVLARIRRAAENASVQWQYKKPSYGGTDGGKIALTGSGVATGAVSVPCRYIHGPAALLRVQDIIDTIALVTEFCRLP